MHLYIYTAKIVKLENTRTNPSHAYHVKLVNMHPEQSLIPVTPVRPVTIQMLKLDLLSALPVMLGNIHRLLLFHVLNVLSVVIVVVWQLVVLIARWGLSTTKQVVQLVQSVLQVSILTKQAPSNAPTAPLDDHR
jgi:hypothetical protein